MLATMSVASIGVTGAATDNTPLSNPEVDTASIDYEEGEDTSDNTITTTKVTVAPMSDIIDAKKAITKQTQDRNYETIVDSIAASDTVDVVEEIANTFIAQVSADGDYLRETQSKDLLNKAAIKKQDIERKIEEEIRLSKEAEEKRLAEEAAAEAQRQEELEEQRANASTPVSTNIYIGGSKQDWMTAAGIPSSEWWAVDSIVSGESGWNPNAYNNSSGACGLGQQLPCGKWDNYGAWNDPVAALRAMTDYVNGRYGSWSQAVEFRNCVGNCYSSYYNATGGYVFKDHTWY